MRQTSWTDWQQELTSAQQQQHQQTQDLSPSHSDQPEADHPPRWALGLQEETDESDSKEVLPSDRGQLSVGIPVTRLTNEDSGQQQQKIKDIEITLDTTRVQGCPMQYSTFYIQKYTTLATFKALVEDAFTPKYCGFEFYMHEAFDIPLEDNHIIQKGIYHVCANRSHKHIIKIAYMDVDNSIATPPGGTEYPSEGGEGGDRKAP